MTQQRTTKELRKRCRIVRNALRQIASAAARHFQPYVEKIRLGTTKPQMLAYRFIGRRTVRFLPLFQDMDSNLSRSGMNVSFKAYVSLSILTTVLVSLCVLVAVPLLLILSLGLSFFYSVLFGIGISLLSGAFTVIVFYVYPMYQANSLRKDLEDGLSFTAGYMSILAGTGVRPENIFRSLAQSDPSLAVSKLSRTIIRDVSLFGSDVLSALESASNRSPSKRFKRLLQGFIATVHSGGDLEKYLANRSRRYMKLKRIALRRFSDALAVSAEFYVSLLVAGPLILVVMLAVMAMLGGGRFGIFDAHSLLKLLTYVAIPLGSAGFLLVLDMISPRW